MPNKTTVFKFRGTCSTGCIGSEEYCCFLNCHLLDNPLENFEGGCYNGGNSAEKNFLLCNGCDLSTNLVRGGSKCSTNNPQIVLPGKD